MRLFVAVWPSPEAVRILAGLARPELAGTRWTSPEQWHVTLRFVGELEDPRQLVCRLHEFARSMPSGGVVATMGPTMELLGAGRVLAVRVSGLDSLAAAVHQATAGIVALPPPPPFIGHITVARLGRDSLRTAAGHVLGARQRASWRVEEISWRVEEITVVASTLLARGSAYEVIARVPLMLPGA